MATLRTAGNLAISLLRLDGHANIAAANRHHARDPQRTLTLLQALCDFAVSLAHSRTGRSTPLTGIYAGQNPFYQVVAGVGFEPT